MEELCAPLGYAGTNQTYEWAEYQYGECLEDPSSIYTTNYSMNNQSCGKTERWCSSSSCCALQYAISQGYEVGGPACISVEDTNKTIEGSGGVNITNGACNVGYIVKDDYEMVDYSCSSNHMNCSEGRCCAPYIVFKNGTITESNVCISKELGGDTHVTETTTISYG